MKINIVPNRDVRGHVHIDKASTIETTINDLFSQKVEGADFHPIW